ncbi:hypothetical protein OR16_04117 [Cupriavidus basilensis OR16]|uniref:Uncharacterized protein n=1 Tax=Cupriavidus basilensis OR16 TaxID=1127483 RepID=H1RZS0_9BURK|nr:hypothetical protein OR16_04117 [Cupriavidus basilensis OR16]
MEWSFIVSLLDLLDFDTSAPYVSARRTALSNISVIRVEPSSFYSSRVWTTWAHTRSSVMSLAQHRVDKQQLW